jgi:hypothetical protein
MYLRLSERAAKGERVAFPHEDIEWRAVVTPASANDTVLTLTASPATDVHVLYATFGKPTVIDNRSRAGSPRSSGPARCGARSGNATAACRSG